jgi:hypothetical protein
MEKTFANLWSIFKQIIVLVVLFFGLLTPASFFIAFLNTEVATIGFDALGLISQQGSSLVYGVKVSSTLLPLLLPFFMATSLWFYILPISFIVFKVLYGFNQDTSLPWALVSIGILVVLFLIKKKTSLLNWFFSESQAVSSFKKGIFIFSVITVITVFLAYPLSFLGSGGGWIDAQPILFILYVIFLPLFLIMLSLPFSHGSNQKYFACLLYIPMIFFLLRNDYADASLILVLIGFVGLGLGLLARRLYTISRGQF